MIRLKEAYHKVIICENIACVPDPFLSVMLYTELISSCKEISIRYNGNGGQLETEGNCSLN